MFRVPKNVRPRGRTKDPEALRPVVEHGAAQYFQRPVRLDQRSLQTLSYAPRAGRRNQKRSHTSAQVWKALLSEFPLTWMLYASLDFEPDTGDNVFPMAILEPMSKSRIPPEELNWEITFQRLFAADPSSNPGRDVLTEAGREVQATGEMTVDRLTKGLFQARLQTGSPNHILRHVVRRTRGKGVGDDETDWSAWSDRIAGLLDGVRWLDPDLGDQQFTIYHDGARYRLRPSATFSVGPVEPLARSGEGWLARTDVLQSGGPFSQAAIQQLEDLVNGNALEVDFQRFFEVHPEFLLALGPYGNVHSQLVLHHDDGTGLIPDFFLERLDSDFCDILDLKRPSVELVRRQRNRVRYRDTVMEAVAQLDTYRGWFDSPTNRAAFSDRYGASAFRPRVIAVIGRRHSYFDEVERISLQGRLDKDVKIETYDDVLDQARRWRHFVKR